jgi:hypothetical protein
VKQPSPEVTISPIDSFTPEFDRLWEKLSPRFYAIVRRDAQYLNWKYVQQPHIEYARFAVRKVDELNGYVILRKCKPPERNQGIIADIFTDPHDREVLFSTLSFSLTFFKRAGVKDIITATTSPQYQEALDVFGFHKIKEIYPMFHGKVDSDELRASLEPGSWFLGKSDHDWDQYPLAR